MNHYRVETAVIVEQNNLYQLYTKMSYIFFAKHNGKCRCINEEPYGNEMRIKLVSLSNRYCSEDIKSSLIMKIDRSRSFKAHERLNYLPSILLNYI